MARYLFGSFGRIVVWIIIIACLVNAFAFPPLWVAVVLLVLAGPCVAIPAIRAAKGMHPESNRSKGELMENIDECFSERKLLRNWIPVNGIGELNYMLGSTRSGEEPIVSIDFGQTEQGTTIVSIWMSQSISGGLNRGRGTPFFTRGASRALRKIKEAAARIEAMEGVRPEPRLDMPPSPPPEPKPDIPPLPQPEPIPEPPKPKALAKPAEVKKAARLQAPPTIPVDVRQTATGAVGRPGTEISELGMAVLESAHTLVCRHTDSDEVLRLAQSRQSALSENTSNNAIQYTCRMIEESDEINAGIVKMGLNNTNHSANAIRGRQIAGALKGMGESAEKHYLNAMSGLAADSTPGGVRKAIDELSVASQIDHQNRAYPIIIEALQAEL